MKLTIYLILTLCALAYSDKLKCYDCDPTALGRCVTPDKDNAKSTICEDADAANTSGLKKQISDIDKLDIEPRLNEDLKEYECFSLYYEAEPESTTPSGVYRGCVDKSKDLRSSCEYLKERLGANVTSCTTCPDDQCNRDNVGGAAGLTISLGIVVVNLLLCIKIFAF